MAEEGIILIWLIVVLTTFFGGTTALTVVLCPWVKPDVMTSHDETKEIKVDAFLQSVIDEIFDEQ